MVEVAGTINPFKSHVFLLQSTLKVIPTEEWMLVLEKLAKKSLKSPMRKTAPQSTHRMGARPTYTSAVATPATKTAVIIRVQGVNKMKLAEQLKKAIMYIKVVYAVRQLSSKNMVVLVHPIFQRDAIFRMAKLKGFCVLNQDYPIQTLGVLLGL